VTEARLLIAGQEVYAAMWAAIDGAGQSVQLETYIWKHGRVAERFLTALGSAASRGLKVELLLDTFGTDGLAADYFAALTRAGVRLTWFNPGRLLRYSFRNHRKLLVVDGATAIVGGLNIADEYAGDGINEGWRDFAVELRGALVAELSASFTRMQQLAPFTPRSLRSFTRANHQRHRKAPQRTAQLLVCGPGTRTTSLRRRLLDDLRSATDVGAYAAYLLPPVRMRRALRAAARHGVVRLITGARNDVALMQWAAERLYAFWLRSGVQLHEYQPQIMHGKLLVIDDIVYIGSANLDVRSLRINYELLVRIESAELAAQVRATMNADISRSKPLLGRQWRASRRWWQALRSWWAYLLLVRVDPFLARPKLRR
jgi:cardiolipin synthase